MQQILAISGKSSQIWLWQWTPSPMPNFVKIDKGDWSITGIFITKNPYFDNLGGLQPTFLTPQW